MRVAKFNVPVLVLPEFLDYINTKGLKGTIVSKKDDVYTLEVAYTKEQSPIIDKMEELVEVLVVLTIVSISVIAHLVTQKSQSKKPAPSKVGNKKYCFFKDFVSQNTKN